MFMTITSKTCQLSATHCQAGEIDIPRIFCVFLVMTGWLMLILYIYIYIYYVNTHRKCINRCILHKLLSNVT